MSRTLPLLLVAAFLLALAIGTLGYLAYADGQAAGAAVVPGLRAPAEIAWLDPFGARIEASDRRDALAALGFAHAAERAWPAVLWRQIARGELAEWVGPEALPFDRHARQLRLAAEAETAYPELPEEVQADLTAYAAGFSAGVASGEFVRPEPLALLGVDLEPWRPEDVLAVERLMAWLAAPVPDSLPDAPAVRAFARTDRSFRQLAHHHGFEHSAAWAAPDSTGATLAYRLVQGASVLPLLSEAVMLVDGAETTLACIPGTLVCPAGRSGPLRWARLLGGTYAFVQAPAPDSSAYRFDRALVREGGETLVTYDQADDLLFLERPDPANARPAAVDSTVQADSTATAPVAADSVWAVRWHGYTAPTDAAAWRGALSDGSGTFDLFRGGGLAVRASGVEVLGSPQTYEFGDGGLLVSNGPWAASVAVALDTLARRRTDPQAARTAAAYSAWAARLSPLLISSLDSVSAPDARAQQALTYLRNWNHTYDRVSVAAPILDMWVDVYERQTGRRPDADEPDSTADIRQRYESLLVTLDTLRASLGPDISRWRWENFAPSVRQFPLFSADSLVDPLVWSSRRFDPVEIPSSGHATAPAWGATPVTRGLPAPSVWVVVMPPGDRPRFEVQRRHDDLERLLGRYRVPSLSPSPEPFSAENDVRAVTRLEPSR